jgi:Protein of unknown function (DUF3775)
MFTVPIEKVCFIIAKAREFDVKVAPPEMLPGDNSIDDDGRDVLLDAPGDPTFQELTDAIEALNEDESAELVALAWIGRADYTAAEWKEAVGEARRHPTGRARYLTGMPLLADYLEEGIAAFERSCEDV